MMNYQPLQSDFYKSSGNGKYKLRKIAEENVFRTSSLGYLVKVDVLECGHEVRHRDPDSTAEAITFLAHEFNGTSRKRRCYRCGDE